MAQREKNARHVAFNEVCYALLTRPQHELNRMLTLIALSTLCPETSIFPLHSSLYTQGF